MKIQKIISSLLAVCLLGTVCTPFENNASFAITAEAEEGKTVKQGDLTFKYVGDYLEVSQCPTNVQGEIVIPKKVNGVPVVSIGDSAFRDCNLTSITIPDSVSSIGLCAFCYCLGLTSITIPDSVTSIGAGAFGGCSSLTSITIPDSVTSIGGNAFEDCKSLTSITIPDSVTSIGYYAFARCSSLTSVTIPDSVTSIGGYAFYECSYLSSITIPNSVTSIGESAFEHCSGLTSIKIPDSVTSIGRYAFYKCSGLTSITIPDSVTSIGEGAFCDCSGLTSITIPKSVESIGKIAFKDCTKLSKVTILNPNCEIYDAGDTIPYGTIYGYKGSTAQAYAKKWYCDFVALDDEPPTTTTTITETTTTTTETTTTTTETATETTTVTTESSEFSVGKTEITLKENEQYKIPANQSDLVYKSSNTDVAVVSKSGVITAWGLGNAIISVMNSDGDVIQIKVTVSSEETAEYKAGDANLDGKVSISDSVKILQYLANSEKFPLSEQAKINADVDGVAGVTGKDAAVIQMYDAKVILELPIK